MPGALDGVRVVELASEWGAYTGKVVAELGADVVLVEPPGGHHTRSYGPFVAEQADREGSLWFWHYNTSKRGVTLDLDTADGRDGLRSLLDRSDVLLEAEPPGRLAALGLDWSHLVRDFSSLIMVSITPFGPAGPRRDEHATDLTLLATGGPVWSCGYDDHTLPPVRGGGNQAMHIGGHFAVMSLLVAIIAREGGLPGPERPGGAAAQSRVAGPERPGGAAAQSGGPGQHIDVNLNAAANVTTEFASYGWLAAEETVQRLTGRHASPTPSQPTQVQCADGRWLNTGVLPRRPAEFAKLLDWLKELNLLDEFPLASLLEVGSKEENLAPELIREQPLIAEIYGAAREATALIASRVPAYEAFVGFQQRGIAVGVIYSPEEVMDDPHFLAHGFPVEVTHEALGRTITYPGAPYRFSRTPWALTRPAPHLGEHNGELL